MGELRFLAVPLVIIAFNATFMFIMRTILLSFSKEVTPFIALLIAASILVGAAALSRRGAQPTPSEPADHHPTH